MNASLRFQSFPSERKGSLINRETQAQLEEIKKSLPVLFEQQLANSENKAAGNCVHLVMQLSAGARVLISKDYMTASEKSKEAEIFILFLSGMWGEKNCLHDAGVVTWSSFLERLDPLKAAAC